MTTYHLSAALTGSSRCWRLFNNSSGLRTRLNVMDIRVQAHGVADDDGISFFNFSGVGLIRKDGKQQAEEKPRYYGYDGWRGRMR